MLLMQVTTSGGRPGAFHPAETLMSPRDLLELCHQREGGIGNRKLETDR